MCWPVICCCVVVFLFSSSHTFQKRVSNVLAAASLRLSYLPRVCCLLLPPPGCAHRPKISCRSRLLVGQTLFLYLTAAFLVHVGRRSARGMAVLPAAYSAHPFALLMLVVQVPGSAFNLFLCGRGWWGVFTNMTANEMHHWQRYEHRVCPQTGRFRNPFDKGPRANFAQFWFTDGK